MKAVIYDPETGKMVGRKVFETLGGAKRSLTALRKRFEKNPTAYAFDIKNSGRFVAATVEDYHKSDAYAYSQELVPVFNNITGDGKKPIMIKRELVGTCCDPSTETYHSM